MARQRARRRRAALGLGPSGVAGRGAPRHQSSRRPLLTRGTLEGQRRHHRLRRAPLSRQPDRLRSARRGAELPPRAVDGDAAAGPGRRNRRDADAHAQRGRARAAALSRSRRRRGTHRGPARRHPRRAQPPTTSPTRSCRPSAKRRCCSSPPAICSSRALSCSTRTSTSPSWRRPSGTRPRRRSTTPSSSTASRRRRRRAPTRSISIPHGEGTPVRRARERRRAAHHRHGGGASAHALGGAQGFATSRAPPRSRSSRVTSRWPRRFEQPIIVARERDGRSRRRSASSCVDSDSAAARRLSRPADQRAGLVRRQRRRPRASYATGRPGAAGAVGSDRADRARARRERTRRRCTTVAPATSPCTRGSTRSSRRARPYRVVAANLANPEESNIAPKRQLSALGHPLSAPEAGKTRSPARALDLLRGLRALARVRRVVDLQPAGDGVSVELLRPHAL